MPIHADLDVLAGYISTRWKVVAISEAENTRNATTRVLYERHSSCYSIPVGSKVSPPPFTPFLDGAFAQNLEAALFIISNRSLSHLSLNEGRKHLQSVRSDRLAGLSGGET